MASARRVEDPHVAEAGVGDVVVEHHRRAGRRQPAGERAEPGGLVDVAGHEQRGRGGDLRRGDDQAEHVERPQRLGHVSGAPNETCTTRAAPLQGDPQGERAAERVRVGPHVGEQGDVLGAGKQAAAAAAGRSCADVRRGRLAALRPRCVDERRWRSRTELVAPRLARGAVRVGVARGLRADGAAGHLRVRLARPGEQLLHPAGLVGHLVLRRRSGWG